MKSLLFLILLVISLLAGLVGTQPVYAANGGDFKAGYIIDDSKFTNNGSMNAGDIHNFLVAKNSVCLINYNGTGWVANVIKQEADNYGINPQVLLVTLQKENGLITTTDCASWKYQTAMGFGCPDGSPCDSQWYGFQNQMHQASRHFRGYYDQTPGWFIPFAPGTYSISYHPGGSTCPSPGASNVNITNRATASLYSYTPYQPNQAALNNLYGSGDGCSSYGNRNFWRDYNDWFGPSTGEGYTLARGTDNRQWVIHRTLKQYVPSIEIKQAWGLPDEAVLLDDATLNTFATGPNLDRLFRINSGNLVYFVDSGKRYPVASPQMLTAWNLDGVTISSVPLDLANLPSEQSYLSYAVKKGTSATYMVDGANGSSQTILRQYLYPNTLKAWEGDSPTVITVSDAYFDSIDNAIGTSLSTTKIAFGGSEYQVVSGQKLPQSAAVAPLYPGVAQSVSSATFNRLATSNSANAFVRASNGNEVFLMDGGDKHHVTSGELLSAWSLGGVVNVNLVNAGYIDLLSPGSNLSSFEADVGGQLYLLDGQKIVIPASLDSAYRNGTPYSASATLMNLYASCACATNFVKGEGPAIYLLDAGKKLHITNGTDWALWNGSRGEALTTMHEAVLGAFSAGSSLGHYFSAGGTNYVIDNGTHHSVSSGVATDWGLSGPVSIATATRDRFIAGSALETKAKVGSGYYRVKYAKSHITFNSDMAALWGLATSPTEVSQTFINTVPVGVSLGIFVRSSDPGDQRIFIADNAGANLYHLSSIDQVFNYGYDGTSAMMSIAAADLGTVTSAKDIIKNSSSGTERVLDGGSKRDFNNANVKNLWVTGSNVLSVSDTLWAFIPVGSNLAGNIKGSAPNVYTMDSGQKRWLQSAATYQTYASQYGSFSNISERLLNLLPVGNSIP